MNKIVKTLAVMVALFCMVIAFFLPEKRVTAAAFISTVKVIIVDHSERQFVDSARVVNALCQADVLSVHGNINKVNTEAMEQVLLKHPMLQTAEVVLTPSRQILIKVAQRHPLLRVMGSYGQFFIDEKGAVMPIPKSMMTALDLPLATGSITKEYARKKLYPLARFIANDEFWNAQIVQIYVRSPSQVRLVTRVGNCAIDMGTADDYENKLENLYLFYQQAMPKLGWIRYNTINLDYKNQIVCTKK